MRELHRDQIMDTVRKLCIEANVHLPCDLRSAIETAAQTEESPVGRQILADIIANYNLAEEKGLPICQDTGMAVVFADLGQEVHIVGGSLEEAVNEGVARGYIEGALRCSVVEDPLRRANTNDNTPAILHLRLVPGDKLELTVAPKGFGSENKTVVGLLSPSATRADVVNFVTAAVEKAGSDPCPPVVVGVGLGGTVEKAAELAKRALLLPVDTPNPDPFYADMEGELLEKINALGIGPQGLGGSTTALGVHILPHATHIAGLPCAVSIGCHVTRHAGTVL